MIDHSGSMRPKMASVIAAARTFIQSSSPEEQMFVVNFNENVTLGLPAKSRIRSARWISRTRSRTPRDRKDGTL